MQVAAKVASILLSGLLVLQGCTSAGKKAKPSLSAQQKRAKRIVIQYQKVQPLPAKHSDELGHAHGSAQPNLLEPWHIQEDFEVTHEHYHVWKKAHPANKAADYQKYLAQSVGNIPPIWQVLTSARSWAQCGFEPFEVPPGHYWHNIVPTLRMVNLLQERGYLPIDIKIVSVYRNQALNSCAEGSAGSKHLLNAAVDIRINYQDDTERMSVEESLCEFWRNQGEPYDLGLGLYRSGIIHIDTQGYRSWGGSYGSGLPSCAR